MPENLKKSSCPNCGKKFPITYVIGLNGSMRSIRCKKCHTLCKASNIPKPHPYISLGFLFAYIPGYFLVRFFSSFIIGSMVTVVCFILPLLFLVIIHIYNIIIFEKEV